MKTGFYPGCSMKGSSPEYKESLLAVAETLGSELTEVPDWNCCGATAAHNLNRDLSLALPARILANAEKAGMEEIVVPCAACYSRLKVSRHELLEDEELRRRISAIIESDYQGSARVLNVVEWLERLVPDIEARLKKPFAHAVACYYGCLLVRPPKILNFDRPEDPQSLDNLMRKIGATPIDWAFKVECCGAGFSVSRTDLIAKLSGQIVDDALLRGAEAIIVACPMCQYNLDMRRAKIDRYLGKKTDIPIVYITQAIGLALGIDRKKLGLQRHKVAVKLRERKAPAAETAAVPAEKTANTEA